MDANKQENALNFVSFKAAKIPRISIKSGKGLSVFSDLNENELKKGKLKFWFIYVFIFLKSHMSKLKMSLTNFKLKNDKAILKKSNKHSKHH